MLVKELEPGTLEKKFEGLSLGASRYEALLPYIRKCLRSAVRPTLANIATADVVFSQE